MIYEEVVSERALKNESKIAGYADTRAQQRRPHLALRTNTLLPSLYSCLLGVDKRYV